MFFFFYSFPSSVAYFPTQAISLILFACLDSFSNLKIGLITKKDYTLS